ncbi:MAG: ABC transporter substrate-binding protein [bacterium]|nr:ABC transporter substrate-binding protein [bacterium]
MKICTCTHAVIIVFTIVFTLTVAGIFTIGEATQPEPVKLKVLLLPFLSFAPFFIAEEEGYFAEQGLEIEFVTMHRSTEALPLLIQGELDVVGATIDFGLLNAIGRGGTINIVADKGYIASTGCTYQALLARRTLVEAGELEGPAQLAGKRIAVRTKSSAGYYVEKVLSKAHLTFEQVVTKYLPPPVRPEALQQGTIDVVSTAEPWITRILEQGNAVLWIPAEDVVPDFQLAAIMYGPTLLHENSETGQRFMAAYLKAVRQYNQGKTGRNVDILVEYTGLTPELLQQACWPAIHDDGHINFQTVLDLQKWGLEKGLLDTVVPEVQLWDGRFIEYANQTLK